MLRPGILEGQAAMVRGGGSLVAERLRSLGAAVVEKAGESLDVLVWDGGAVFRAAAASGPEGDPSADRSGPEADASEDRSDPPSDGSDPLAPFRACVDGAWELLREAATGVWIPGEGGKAILIAPRPGDGDHAASTRAALENAARTLSIEWARYGVRTIAITPGDATTDDEIAGVVAYLASPGGDYFSGARMDLGAVPLCV
jgi:NAD(P)-dependent dehydrogenase (short-subunit alcohol dehydrogenase family)